MTVQDGFVAETYYPDPEEPVKGNPHHFRDVATPL
jgi:hypothetical protein